MKTQKETPDLSAFDSSEYDVEAMAIEARNGNLDPEYAENYRHENIVSEAIALAPTASGEIRLARCGAVGEK
jgi:hypothetical protein